VDVRVVAASNRNLKAETTAGRFRSDLYYRLNVVHITLPPLRERPEDIPLLADHFLKKYARETGRENFRIHPEALRYLLDYPWPGNVRELENTIERAVILAAEEVITPRDLPQEIRRPRTSTVEAGSTEPVLSPREPGIAPMPEESDLARRLPHSPHRHRQLRALELVRSLGSVTNRDYSQLNDISERQALRELNEMVDLGVLERIGKGRASRYVLQENRRPTP
jgi:two-component system NtrC family response regulator